MAVVMESRYTREARAIAEAEQHAELREALDDLIEGTVQLRGKANEILDRDQSPEARHKASKLRWRATYLEKHVVQISDMRHGLGEWAPGGKYATPEYLARKEAQGMAVSA